MDIFRVTARWTGFQGAPGYSAFHFATGGGLISDAQQVADRVSSAFEAIMPLLPLAVNINIEPEVEVLASETGEVQAFHQITPPEALSGGSGEAYSAASGAVVNWRTNDVRFGRRIRGRTFIVPMGNNAYDTAGSLIPVAIGNLNVFGSRMIGGDIDSEFGVWSRPRDGAGGVFATVTSATVPDLAAVLRSRRD